MYVKCNTKYIESTLTLTVNVLTVKGLTPSWVMPISALAQFVSPTFEN